MLSLQNISLFEGSSSAKADGTQTVASQQTYCLWYMRAASCRKQPKTKSAPHRGTILIQALFPPCVLKTVSSPYLHKAHNSRLHLTYANTDCECLQECIPATTGHSSRCPSAIFWSRQSWCTQWLLPDERWGGGGGGGLFKFYSTQFKPPKIHRHTVCAAVCSFYWSLLFCCWRGPLVNEMLLLSEMTCISVKLIISHDQIASW